jgi:hypothetical protein
MAFLEEAFCGDRLGKEGFATFPTIKQSLILIFEMSKTDTAPPQVEHG